MAIHACTKFGAGFIGLAAFLAFPAQAEPNQSSPPRLIAFDGINQLAAEASRVGMLSQVLHYTLTVDAAGRPTDCAISREFRRKYIKIALCRPLLKHHTFEPARNDAGNPVEGKYSASIDFRMFFHPGGGSNARDL